MSQEKPILYSYFRSSASYRVRIALNLKKVDYEYEAVHLIRDGGEQNALNYRAINPMGQVPTLVDGMSVIAQSMAIIDYVDKKWTQSPKLFSSDLSTNASIIEICEIINSGIQPITNLKVTQYLEKELHTTEEQTKKWVHKFMNDGFIALEKRLSKTAGACCFGNQITAADVFLVPAVFAAIRQGVKMDPYPLVKKINDHLIQLEAFKKAHPSCQPDTPQEN